MDINFLPKPPTDNLYKFAAILGLWLLIFTIAIAFFISFITYQIEQETDATARLMSHNSKLHQIEKRLSSIDAGDIEQNVLNFSRVHDGSEQEIIHLNELKALISQKVEAIKSNSTNYARSIEVFWKIKLHWFLYILPIISATLFFFGFRQWYIKIQKPSETAMVQQLRINELTIKQLEKEIVQAKKVLPHRYNSH